MPTLYVLYYKYILCPPNQKVFPTPLNTAVCVLLSVPRLESVVAKIFQDTTFGDKGGIPRMTTHGNIGEFNRAKEDWVSYCERMQQYFMANDIATDDLRRKQFC